MAGALSRVGVYLRFGLGLVAGVLPLMAWLSRSYASALSALVGAASPPLVVVMIAGAGLLIPLLLIRRHGELACLRRAGTALCWLSLLGSVAALVCGGLVKFAMLL